MTELGRFFWERRGEIAALTGQHLLLVAASAALAVAIGIPLGVALTRRPALRQVGAIVLGLGFVFLGMALMTEATGPLRTYEPFVSFMS